MVWTIIWTVSQLTGPRSQVENSVTDALVTSPSDDSPIMRSQMKQQQVLFESSQNVTHPTAITVFVRWEKHASTSKSTIYPRYFHGIFICIITDISTWRCAYKLTHDIDLIYYRSFVIEHQCGQHHLLIQRIALVCLRTSSCAVLLQQWTFVSVPN